MFVASGDVIERTIVPDGRVYETAPTGSTFAPHAGGGTAVLAEPSILAEPILIAVPDAEVRQRLITVREVTGERVVIVIEFFCPTNKRPGNGLRSYRDESSDRLAAGVNLVEVDLTRGTPRPFVFHVPGANAADYAVSVWRAAGGGRRAAHPTRAEFDPIGLRDRLPAFRVPLRPEDGDVVLNLRPIVELAHRNGARHRIDHARLLDPPLSDADAAWANALTEARRDHGGGP